mgnify:CR=1 FL=1
MPIIAIAIVGKNNEPLYLSDCDFEKGVGEDEKPDDAQDYFGFSEEASQNLDREV